MQSSHERDQTADLIVVGGGLAGLMTAALVAGAGRKVVVLERSSRPGGRAITRVERRYSLQPRAACAVLPRAGLPAAPGTGGSLHGRGSPTADARILTDEDRSYAIPRGIGSVLASRLLTTREKWTFLRLFAGIPPAGCPRVRPHPARGLDRGGRRSRQPGQADPDAVPGQHVCG